MAEATTSTPTTSTPATSTPTTSTPTTETPTPGAPTTQAPRGTGGGTVVIDPVTRIEGHLRITAVVEDGRVTDAWNHATMFRGFEIFMRNRDPRDAWHFGQRICGVCPNPHAWNGAKCAETAMGLDVVPDGARLVRNMMEAAQIGYDHILHFYILQAFDYVNVPDSLNAKAVGPVATAIQNQVKALVGSGQLGPFANHYWDHPGYALPPELNLELTAHYLESIRAQQMATDAIAYTGGKYPMIMNYAAGGVTEIPKLEEVLYWRGRMQAVKDFVDTVMVPDLLAVAPFYLDLATYGQGTRNLLTWGVVDEESQDPYDRLFPRGAIFDGDLGTVQKVDPDDTRIFTQFSFYEDSLGAGRHPLEESVERGDKIDYTGLPPVDGSQTPAGKYDWTMAARLGDDARPMEVGPLAQMVVAYASGREDAKALVDMTLEAVGQAGKPAVLFSTLGRVAARVLKAKMNADASLRWADELVALIQAGKATPAFFELPNRRSGTGKGGWDGPRGALCHHMRVEGGTIDAYAAVPASNWNLSPRDDDGRRGPVEEALIGTPVFDPERPLEILRTVHSFDP